MTPWRPALDAARRANERLPASRYAQLSTVRLGGPPANRTVVVRGLIDPGDLIAVTTDARSAKAKELDRYPWAEVCWMFTETREQFRLMGWMTVAGPDAVGRFADERGRMWAALPEPSRQAFVWPPPGEPRADDSAFKVATPETAPPNFALLLLEPSWVEHLDLRRDPHARTRFELTKAGWSVQPVNP